jgi:hypothetical protein
MDIPSRFEFNNLTIFVSCFPRAGKLGGLTVLGVLEVIEWRLNEDDCSLLFRTFSEFVGRL